MCQSPDSPMTHAYQIALDSSAPKTMPKTVLTHGLAVSGQAPEEHPMKRYAP